MKYKKVKKRIKDRVKTSS